MGKWSNRRDREGFWRMMVIVYHHPDYRDLKPIEAMRKLKRHRREQRRERHRQRLNPDDTDTDTDR